jgi:hypothetical protein
MDQWLESFGKGNDGAGLLDTPSTTAMPDPLDLTGTILSTSPAELKTIKEEDLQDSEETTTVNTRTRKRPNKRTSSESSSSPDPVPAPATKAAPTKTSRRQPHNEIEKKYRESINTHLEALKNSIPAFQSKSSDCLHGKGDIEDLAAAPKPSKSIILASAVAHIKKVEKEKRQLEQERNLLRQQVKALQALVKCDDCSVMNYVAGLNGLNLGTNNVGRGSIGRMS